ncbi:MULTISPECIES: hypothetical protein [Pseudomonas]|uniref:Uncharacterized protein n=1 Tax=Pseudomonas fluorescens (strain Q2-87) TaxID=1038922 RepID=J2EZQ3_PSEFQ|nr:MULTISPECIES: hypothetical protein [Pseudomonas]EJL02143.1 hypothetical protein PflQ2_3835 [Pseudomonas fluorescens Q2-87]
MMHSTELSLGFKGERTYIQGADILCATMQSIMDRAPDARIEKLDFKIGRMTSHLLSCHWWPRSAPQTPGGNDIASFTFHLDGVEHEGRLIQAEGLAETRRAYDESLVNSNSHYSPAKHSISLTNMPANFSSIEVLISLNKALHLKELCLPSAHQWVFCRWESPEWPLSHELGGVELTIEQTLGTRLTRTRIELGSEQIGTIYFSALNVD